VVLKDRFDYAQLVVLARLSSGEIIDATRMVQTNLSEPVVTASPAGLLRPRANGKATLKFSLDGQSAELAVTVCGLATDRKVDFVRDVAPVLSRLGCNAG